jgi:hypothetical protein
MGFFRYLRRSALTKPKEAVDPDSGGPLDIPTRLESLGSVITRDGYECVEHRANRRTPSNLR